MKVSKKRHEFYVICLVVVIASSLFDFNNGAVQDSFTLNLRMTPIIIGVIFVAIIIFAGNHYLKDLTIWQKVTVIILHAVVIFLPITFMQGIVTYLMQYITNGWVESILKFILLCGILIPTFMILESIGLKLTNGKFKKQEQE